MSIKKRKKRIKSMNKNMMISMMNTVDWTTSMKMILISSPSTKWKIKKSAYPMRSWKRALKTVACVAIFRMRRIGEIRITMDRKTSQTWTKRRRNSKNLKMIILILMMTRKRNKRKKARVNKKRRKISVM